MSSLRVQTGRHQRRPDSAVRKQSARQWKLEWDATLMALSPTHYRERSGESSGSSHLIWTSASVRTGNSSCGSRRALRWSSARRGPYRPSPASAMTPAAGPILRVGAALSFFYPAYLTPRLNTNGRVWESICPGMDLHSLCGGLLCGRCVREPVVFCEQRSGLRELVLVVLVQIPCRVHGPRPFLPKRIAHFAP